MFSILQDDPNVPSDSIETQDSVELEDPLVVAASAENSQVGNGGESAQSIPRVNRAVNGTVQTNGLSVAADDGP